MLHRVALVRTGVWDELNASFIRVTALKTSSLNLEILFECYGFWM
jgi:hypothetical protein